METISKLTTEVTLLETNLNFDRTITEFEKFKETDKVKAMVTPIYKNNETKETHFEVIIKTPPNNRLISAINFNGVVLIPKKAFCEFKAGFLKSEMIEQKI